MTMHREDRRLYRLARTAQGMTQATVATAAGTARECINRFERGTEALSPRTLYKMALSLNFSPAFLHSLATCPFNSHKLIKMELPDTGWGIDYAMIHFLAEHCRRLELVFLWGRFRSWTPSSENHVFAIAARDNEGNVFLLSAAMSLLINGHGANSDVAGEERQPREGDGNDGNGTEGFCEHDRAFERGDSVMQAERRLRNVVWSDGGPWLI